MVLEKLEGVNKVLISGTTAFVTTKSGTSLEDESLKKAFKDTGLKYTGVEDREIATTGEFYQITVTGGT